MDRNKLLRILQETGLSEKEACIYHAALSLGPATTSELSRAAGVKRPTTYSLVDSLKQKGLLSSEIRGFKTLHVAESPEKIDRFFDSRRQSYQNALPKLLELYDFQERGSDIRRYEGLNSIKSVYSDLLQDIRAHDYYLAICDMQQWFEIDSRFFKEFVARRAKLPLNIRILTTDSAYARERKKQEILHNNQIRFLPAKTALTTNLIVTPQKVVIHDLLAPVGATIIKSRSTVQMHREMFEIIWNSQPD